MYKVSVIMPIYNAEKYLRTALDSVVNQSMGFGNIELILVDDKSTDNSRGIVEEYSSKYSNIVPIFLEENSGCPGIPRNIGIKHATSDYIMFIDNDDEYFPEMCDKLYNTMISEDADIVVCDVCVTDSFGSKNWAVDSDKIVGGGEIIYFDNVFVWNCIFKKSIIISEDISFIDGVNEDALFTLEYYMHSEKLVYLNDFVGYNTFIRGSSLSNVSFDFEEGLVKSYYLQLNLLEGNSVDLNRFFKIRVADSIMRAMMLENKDEITKVLSDLVDFEKSINFTGNLPTLYRFINFFIMHGNLNISIFSFFISKFRNSELLLKIYRKFFLKIFRKFIELK